MSGTVLEEVDLGTVEELLHKHSCDAIIPAANGIAAEMNEAFGGQEIGGSRIGHARPPRKRGPILRRRRVDLRLDAGRPSEHALLVLLQQWTCHIAPFQQRVYRASDLF